MKIRYLVAAVFAAAIGYGALVVIMNGNLQPKVGSERPAPQAGLAAALPATITVSDWNIGYAGLGKASDFIADMGSSILPPSREAVTANLAGIVETLRAHPSDIFLVQEVSDGGPLSYWVPVWDQVRGAFGSSQVFYRPDVATWGLPWPIAINHGTVIAVRANPSAIETIAIPNEPGLMMGFLRRRYALQVVRVPIEGQTSEWVVANLHLSAFDDGGVTRIEQLKAVLKFGADEYAKGNHVILGGDWNMRLSATSFPTTTEEKYLFWLMDFPRDQLDAGWSIVSDPNLPTVRTLYKPYVAGENYTTIIDGFIVSPNVVADSVTTHDTGFAISDHMPQTAVFTARP